MFAKLRLTHLFFALLVMFSAELVYSQAVKDSLVAVKHFKKADSLLFQKEFKTSIVQFEKALTLYKRTENWEKVTECYNKISENQWRNVTLKEALNSAKKALEIGEKKLSENHLQKARAHDNLGTCYKLNGADFSLVFKHYNIALKIRTEILEKDHEEFAISYFNLGSVKNIKGLHDEALEDYKKALAIKTKAVSNEDIEIADIYEAVGHVFYDTGKYDEALIYFEKAHEIANRTFKKDNFYFVKILNKIGIIYYFKKQYNESLKYYKNALGISVHNLGKDHPDQARLHYNIAMINNIQNNKEEALFHAKKTLNIGVKAFGENHRDLLYPYSFLGQIYRGDKGVFYAKKALAICVKNLGEYHLQTAYIYAYMADFYKEMKKYDLAVEYIKKALNIRLKIFGKHNPTVINSYNWTAKLFLEKEEYNTALEYVEKAIEANTKPTINQSRIDSTGFDAYISLKSYLLSISTKASILKESYQRSNDIMNLESSVALYERASQLISIIRKTENHKDDKVTFADEVKDIYKGSIEAQMLLYAIKDDTKLLEEAFKYSEQSKANVLKELLNDTNAKVFSEIPEKILIMEKNLKKELASFQSRLSKEIVKSNIDTLKISALEGNILDLSRKQDSLTQVLEDRFPKYYQLKHKNDVIAVVDIKKYLDAKTTLIEFFITDSGLYAFVISKKGLRVKLLSILDLNAQVEALRQSIIQKNTNTYKEVSYQLYQDLIVPIKDDIVGNTLIVIPDGALWHLNFDLLLTSNDSQSKFKDFPYLLKEYLISYGNSADILFSKPEAKSKEKNLRKECLAFSYSNEEALATGGSMLSLETLRDSDEDLPGTRKEIKAISEIVAGNYFFGSTAIESNFKKNSSNYSVVHLALHGEVDNENPENSKIYFSKVQDTIEDNLLYGHELYALNIPADLMVLSACNTGTGKITKGEGILSLGTAFQYAGTKSLLLSSWEVPDKTTPGLMKQFYSHLNQGMSKAQALRQAKLDYLENSDAFTSHPFYWGGFYLIGDSTPIEFDNQLHIHWLIYVLMALFLVLTYAVVRRKVNRAIL